MKIHIMRAQKTRTERRRNQIVRVPFAAVARHGLRGLSVARQARAVGVVSSGLYRHVVAKDGVIDLMFDSIAGRLEASLALARTQGGTALDRLRGLLDRHVELVSHNSAIPRMLFSEELLRGRVAHRRQLYETVCGYLEGVERPIRAGQEGGEIDAETDPAAASLLFLGLMQPIVLLWAMSRAAFNPHSATDSSWSLYVSAITSSQDSAQAENKLRINQAR